MNQSIPPEVMCPPPLKEDKQTVVVCFSKQGLSHKQRGLPCQDYSKHITTMHGWHVVAIADGVGSLRLSEKASQCAVEAVCQFWSVFSGNDEHESCMFSCIRASMNYALQKVAQLQDNLGSTLETTLHIAILTNHSLYWGHCGDGGVFISLTNGDVKAITSPMIKKGHHVIPLSAGPSAWECGYMDAKSIVSVMLATDGAYAFIMHMNDKNQRNSLLEQFMNPSILPSMSDDSYHPLAAHLKLTCQKELSSVEDDISLALIHLPDKKPATSNGQDQTKESQEKELVSPPDKASDALTEKQGHLLQGLQSWISRLAGSVKLPWEGK